MGHWKRSLITDVAYRLTNVSGFKRSVLGNLPRVLPTTTTASTAGDCTDQREGQDLFHLTSMLERKTTKHPTGIEAHPLPSKRIEGTVCVCVRFFFSDHQFDTSFVCRERLEQELCQVVVATTVYITRCFKCLRPARFPQCLCYDTDRLVVRVCFIRRTGGHSKHSRLSPSILPGTAASQPLLRLCVCVCFTQYFSYSVCAIQISFQHGRRLLKMDDYI